MGCKPSKPPPDVDSDDNSDDDSYDNSKSCPKAAPEIEERPPQAYAVKDKKIPERKVDPYKGAPKGSKGKINVADLSENSDTDFKKPAGGGSSNSRNVNSRGPSSERDDSESKMPPEVVERKPRPYATKELSDPKLDLGDNLPDKPDNVDKSKDEKSNKRRGASPPAKESSSSKKKPSKSKETPQRQGSVSSNNSDSEDDVYVPPKRKEKADSGSKSSSNKNLSKTPSSRGKDSNTPRGEYEGADSKKWKTTKLIFGGAFTYETKGESKEVDGSIKKGIEKFKANPQKYVCLFHQTNMTSWPNSEQKYVLVFREGTSAYTPKNVGTGHMTLYMHSYESLPAFPDDELPQKYRDNYTDDMKHHGRKLHSASNLPIMPGRGMGICDTPNLKIIGDVDPSDIKQGSVGDCWLLSGISSLAEFDGAIKHLFRKTKRLDDRPLSGANMYTVTLWDLETWTERDIEIDERLPVMADGSRKLLASKPSSDGELWVCYLEKAVAAHCGGWDKITGGQCTHAWSLLTGCKFQYTIRRNAKSKKFQCFGKFDPNKKQWMRHANSPHDGEKVTWPMSWPEVGGGGDMSEEFTDNELFQKMVAWDKSNYIVGCGCQSKAGDKGLVDNHAYSVIECHKNVAGTGIDMLKVRNPWGSGEIESGMFDDDGPGWEQYPEIKKFLKPVAADDGIFWVTKQEFFEFFATIYLCASNMTKFLED